MKPPKINHAQGRLFCMRTSSWIDPNHPLKRLADSIDWSYFEKELSSHYKEGCGYPPKPIRLMIGMLMLEYMHKQSDEQVVVHWIENPYWQYFCGYDYAEWKAPIDPSSLTRFRNRIGKEGVGKILQATIQEALKQGYIKPKDFKKVIADTTVMDKNIAHPIDTALLNKSRKKLIKLAKRTDVKLRQNYERVGPKAVLQASRYAHAKQFKRMRKVKKKLKTYLGRVVRDVRQ